LPAKLDAKPVDSMISDARYRRTDVPPISDT